MKTKPKSGFSLEETPPPVPGIQKVAIRPLYGAISHTDLHHYHWDEWAQKYGKLPMVVGKEFVGEIIEVGSSVQGLSEGDLVTGDLGFDLGDPGCFASAFVLSASKAILIPEAIEIKSAALLPSLASAVQTILQCSVQNKTILISGARAVGLMSALVAKKMGAKKVVISDPLSYRVNLAEELGIAGLKGEEKFDLAYEISGSPKGLTDCLQKVKQGGSVVLVGFQPFPAQPPWKLIAKKRLQVQGVFAKTPKSWKIAIELAKNGFPLSSFISHLYPFENYEEAFQVALKGRCAKVLLEWKTHLKVALPPSISKAA